MDAAEKDAFGGLSLDGFLSEVGPPPNLSFLCGGSGGNVANLLNQSTNLLDLSLPISSYVKFYCFANMFIHTLELLSTLVILW